MAQPQVLSRGITAYGISHVKKQLKSLFLQFDFSGRKLHCFLETNVVTMKNAILAYNFGRGIL